MNLEGEYKNYSSQLLYIYYRQKLVEFYCETLSLTHCIHELTTAILEHIFCLWPQEASCIEKLVGVISEIRQPMEPIDPTAVREKELSVSIISSITICLYY